MFSFSIPDMEIHSSKQPVALMLFPSGHIKPYKIKPKGKYFVLADKSTKTYGIYTINNKYRWSWGTTPVYFYAVQETNAVDPIVINEINKYRKSQKLTVLERKDIKHGSRLRNMSLQFKKQVEASGGNGKSKEQSELAALKKLKEQEENHNKKITESIAKTTADLENKQSEMREKHQKELNLTSEQKSYILLEHLKSEKLITEGEYANLMYKVANTILSFESLIDELRSLNVVTVGEPLDENVEDFIQDLGAQNAADLAGFIQDLRNDKKGLHDMTPVPVKAWMPAAYLFVIILGAIIGIVVFSQNASSIQNLFGGGGGSSGGGAFDNFPNPFNMMGGGINFWFHEHVIDKLAHIPKLMLRLFMP